MLMLKGRSQTDVNFETPVSNSVLLPGSQQLQALIH
jgi:hypothetical protein